MNSKLKMYVYMGSGSISHDRWYMSHTIVKQFSHDPLIMKSDKLSVVYLHGFLPSQESRVTKTVGEFFFFGDCLL